ncbi:hypothetical protein [Leptospira sarikeiensis]|uniref:Lipoprotein n=1 Tax=Leptospira sarikeiensis TaxID=2484943 RepID=A0A4R9KCX4_9LEPT|nr:hypothetical protein [Leptospira sarikeiensis]TGL62982.1 hypothetical protein EHQ64_07360 [Leptospira sarikeiensis]
MIRLVYFSIFAISLLFISSPNDSVPLDPDQKVYQVGEIFTEEFIKIDFPEKALVRTESRKRWRAVPLKDRPWLAIWRKLDRVGEETLGTKALEAVFAGTTPEKFTIYQTEILRWSKEDISGGNPLQLYFFLLRKGDSAYTFYIAFYKERQDLKDWFSDPNRYLKP